jgi:cytochrome c553
MKKVKVLIAVAVAVALSGLTISSLHATAAKMKEEGKKTCADCHTKGEKPTKDNVTPAE